MIMVQTLNSKLGSIPNTKKLRILQWNIQSANSLGVPKTEHKDFAEILSQCGIFCLQETKAAITLAGYRCFNKLRSDSKSGGLCIGIERDLCNKWKVVEVQSDSDDVLAVHLWTRTSADPILLVNVYDSPTNSTYKKNRCKDQAPTLESVLQLLINHQSSQVLITGDFNARTGTLNHLLVDSEAEVEAEVPKSALQSWGQRVSQDKMEPNARGKLLLEMFAETNTTLLNGNCLGDIHGALTCIKYNGSSVVDYTAVSAPLLDCVSSFRVLDLNSFSDHRPCLTTLRVDASKITCKNLTDKLDDAPLKFKTAREGALDAYEKHVNCPKSVEAASILTRTSCTSKEDVIRLNDQVVKMLVDPAVQAFPRKPARAKGPNFSPKQPWFDKECARAKRLVDKNSKLASSSPDNSIREKLYDSKGAYRRLVKQKKRDYIGGLSKEIDSGSINWSKLRKLKNLRTTNSLDAFDMRNFCTFFRNLYRSKTVPLDSMNRETALNLNSKKNSSSYSTPP